MQGFSITAGIRQGCPLSPLLFALVADLLLRKLDRSFEGILHRAYADDLAVVVADLGRALPGLVSLFSRFGLLSGLRLNLRKVMIVPLGDEGETDVVRQLSSAGPGWGAVQVEERAKYLGFILGPGKADHSWRQAIAKAHDRANAWAKLGLGLYFSILVYRVYVVSVLSFIGQLELPPNSWRQDEKKLFSKLFPGPNGWARPDDFYGLKRDFGFPVEAPDFCTTIRAAKFRIAHREGRQVGGLCRNRWLRRLEEAWWRSEHAGRLGRWSEWFRTSYLRILTDNLWELEAKGITLETVEGRVARIMARPITPAQIEQIRMATQKTANAMLREQEVRNPASRLREKLKDTPLSVLPRVAADRAVQYLRRLQPLVPPRVWAASFRTYMGGWCTASRFQRREPCLFGCRDHPDRRGHYLACPVLEEFGRRRLGLQPTHEPAGRTTAMLGLSSTRTAEGDITRKALLLAAAYRVHCTFRRRRDELQGADTVWRALEQALRDLTKGHPKACAAVDSAWAASNTEVAVRRTA